MNTSTFFVRLIRAFSPALAVVSLFACSFLPAAKADAGGIPANPDRHPAYSAVVVIGDSLSDTGRTAAALGQMGISFPPLHYAPGRVSNGPVWIEYFSPMIRRTYDPLDNFAWAGATTGTQNVLTPLLPGMKNELEELIGAPPAPIDPKALYVVFGGANDFLPILQGADASTVITQGVTNLYTIVRTLHAFGARHLVVVDLPNIGRTPRASALGPVTIATATALSVLFNSQLNIALNSLPFPVVRVSVFNLINDFVARPNKYGFINVTSPGIYDLANADRYLFWDDVHPTTRAHRFVADQVFHALAAAGKLGQQKN